MLNSIGSLNMANIMKNYILSKPNYAKCKYRVDLYIRFYDYSSSFKTNEESIELDKVSYSKWIEANNKMKNLMLGFIVDSLMVSYMNYPSAISIDEKNKNSYT